jgi:hypothetical protein
MRIIAEVDKEQIYSVTCRYLRLSLFIMRRQYRYPKEVKVVITIHSTKFELLPKHTII